MIKELIKLATHLDDKGRIKEADYLDAIIKRATAIDKIAGDLVSLDEHRPRAEEGPPDMSRARRVGLGAMVRDIHSGREGFGELIDIVVLEDGETYASAASIVSLTEEEMDRVDGGEKVYEVVDPDHGAPDARWQYVSREIILE